MNIQITCRHFSAPVELQEQADKKFSKLKQFDNNILSVICVINKEHDMHQIEIRFDSHNKHFIIKHEHESIYTGFDTILDKALRQIKKHISKENSFKKEKIVDRLE